MLWIVTLLSYVWDTIQEWELISVVKYSNTIITRSLYNLWFIIDAIS